jgi:hypothetical protein
MHNGEVHLQGRAEQPAPTQVIEQSLPSRLAFYQKAD